MQALTLSNGPEAGCQASQTCHKACKQLWKEDPQYSACAESGLITTGVRPALCSMGWGREEEVGNEFSEQEG